MVLSKGGDPTNPTHFEVYQDVNGENTKVFLNGEGEALENGDSPFEIPVEYYQESNLLALGVPTSF